MQRAINSKIDDDKNTVNITRSGSAYSDMGEYILLKRKKILEQQQKGLELESDLFKALSFYINGHTNPSPTILREIIIKNGGVVEQTLSTTVDYMIATNLSWVKRQKGWLVLRPEWIIDSVCAGTLLEMGSKYILENTAKEGQGQKRISAFFTDDPQKIQKLKIPSPQDDHKPEITETEYAINDFSKKLQTPLDCNHPKFIENYFGASRLHQMGRWKSSLAQLIESKGCKSTNNSSSCFTNSKNNTIIMHVDIDSFFVSASLLAKPELANNPVAIANSSRSTSGSDLSTCNYKAREFGIHSGMYVKNALQILPSLIILPFEFELYWEISEKIFTILCEFCDEIVVGSCDEAYLRIKVDLFDGEGIEHVKIRAINLAECIKNKIFAVTGMNVSIGIATNCLLAKLATNKVKPNGILFASSSDIITSTTSIKDIPGIGRSSVEKLALLGATNISHILALKLPKLKHVFGDKQGENIWNWCHGEDSGAACKFSQNIKKSLSCNITWGIRFEESAEIMNFLDRQSSYLWEQMEDEHAGSISIKILVKNAGAREPTKHLGHGHCHALNKSLKRKISTLEYLQKSTKYLFKQSFDHISAKNIRGICLTLSDLFSAKPDNESAGIRALLIRNDANSHPLRKEECGGEDSVITRNGWDPQVFKELPVEMQKELLNTQFVPFSSNNQNKIGPLKDKSILANKKIQKVTLIQDATPPISSPLIQESSRDEICKEYSGDQIRFVADLIREEEVVRDKMYTVDGSRNEAIKDYIKYLYTQDGCRHKAFILENTIKRKNEQYSINHL